MNLQIGVNGTGGWIVTRPFLDASGHDSLDRGKRRPSGQGNRMGGLAGHMQNGVGVRRFFPE
jgi:hypothetical protein